MSDNGSLTWDGKKRREVDKIKNYLRGKIELLMNCVRFMSWGRGSYYRGYFEIIELFKVKYVFGNKYVEFKYI